MVCLKVLLILTSKILSKDDYKICKYFCIVMKSEKKYPYITSLPSSSYHAFSSCHHTERQTQLFDGSAQERPRMVLLA